MKIYIAGKIAGDKRYRAKFREAAKTLEAEGHVVLNPATLPDGLEQADYMRICLAMLDTADMAVFLPDYQESKGAMVEWSYCQRIGKDCALYPEMTGGNQVRETAARAVNRCGLRKEGAMKNDLIRRSDLLAKKCIVRGNLDPNSPCPTKVAAIPVDVIERAPSVDAVEVVRCKNCVMSWNCIMFDTLRLEFGIENPYCCAGK